MEHIKNTEFDSIESCPNNYSEETFLESFGKSDDDIRRCSNCQNMSYECGIMSCKKFNL